MAKARVQWEINTALLLLNRPILTASSGAQAPTILQGSVPVRAPKAPPGWQVLLDPDSGAWYYNNLTTGESQWVDDGMPNSRSDVHMAATPPRDSATKRPTASPGLGVSRQRND
jgi:hypothetical protein